MEGSRLGPYELLATLGSGGMGKVYRAEVKGAVPGVESGGAVALKVIHAHLLETPGFFKRFLREADLGRTIEHENVVRTLDCDALLLDGVQQNFLVMEYVEGQTLRDLLEDLERVPEELCRHIGREAAKGLQAIHEAGVVHRDLKPENVLITADHVVKIMDLGVARLQDEAIRLSQTGAFVGSLEYAAPEQFRSADGEPDGRADLHALGVLLYELATGQHPYRDEDAAKVIGNILDVTPRKVGEVNPQLSPFFEEVVHMLLAKNREERIASASALAAVLEEGEASAWWTARAKALRVETQRPLRRIRIPRETALYGRDDDVAWMRRAFGRAKEGEGQVLLIEGEAGIGKTRLVDEVIGRLRADGEDLSFLFGSYPPGGAATAAGAFSTAYREHFGAGDLEDTLKPYLAPTPVLIPAFAALLKGETTPLGASALTRDSLQTVFAHATRGLAAERPTIVLIDDLHFAPEEGRSLFAALALALAKERVLLIGTLRPGVPEAWTAGITRLDHAEQRTLARLGPKDLGRLLRDAFRSDRLADELGWRIAEKSDGNPFFAFEIIRGLREGQFITRQPDGTWVTTRVIRDIEVPSSVLDLVNARVADLGEDERNLLDLASCCGFVFDPVLVGDAQGLDRVPTLRRLGQIERRHRLVRSRGREYAFDHHQVQEALCGGLNAYLKEAYHTALGEALERSLEGATLPDGPRSVDAATHFLKGGRGERALPFFVPALEHYWASHLHGPLVELADCALEPSGLLDGALRAQILFRRGRALSRLGRTPEAAEALREAQDLVGSAHDDALGVRVWRERVFLATHIGAYEDVLETEASMLEVARRIGDPRLLAEALEAAVKLHFTREDLVAAEAPLEEMFEVARTSGNQRILADALGTQGVLHLQRGDVAKARATIERELEVAEGIDDVSFRATALGYMEYVLNSEGRFEEAIANCEQEVELWRSLGHTRNVAISAGFAAEMYARLGRYAQARDGATTQRKIAEECGYRSLEAKARIVFGWIDWAAGSWDEAQTHFAAAIELDGELDRNSPAQHGLLLVARERGRLGEAYDLLERVRHDRPVAWRADQELYVLDEEARLRFALGDLGGCRAAIEKAAALPQVEDDPFARSFLAEIRATVAENEGRLEVAMTEYRDAVAQARTARAEHLTAIALCGLGRVCLDMHDRDEARRALEEAQGLATENGYPDLRVRTACLLALAGAFEPKDAKALLAEFGPRMRHEGRMEAHYVLAKVTQDGQHLEEARRLLDRLLENAPKAYGASMRKNVRLNREILDAWASLDRAPTDGETD